MFLIAEHTLELYARLARTQDSDSKATPAQDATRSRTLAMDVLPARQRTASLVLALTVLFRTEVSNASLLSQTAPQTQLIHILPRLIHCLECMSLSVLIVMLDSPGLTMSGNALNAIELLEDAQIVTT